MTARCVFCGTTPESKTKEHIFPQWLLKMTGFESKKASLGVDWTSGKEILFPANNYIFPACDECNSRFGKIEGKVKQIIVKLQSDRDITGLELELLLDWFDKIRVGTWLGIAYMNKSTFSSPPNYYIDQRVGRKDRFLSITNTYRSERTLNWSGANTLTFMSSPTALALRINGLVFVTASSDFLVSESVGFPFPAWEMQTGSKTADFALLAGSEKVEADCFDTVPYSPRWTVRQPIFVDAITVRPELYNVDYVINNAYDAEGGVGKIFLQRETESRVLERTDTVNFAMPEAKLVFGPVRVVRPILELQLELMWRRLSRLRFGSAEDKEKHLAAAKGIAEYTRQQIREFNY